ncbi:MAG: response regulator [Lentisphaeraceae bacterium]|nr:response regulator [Lentisphaeraceae bacterium]
MTVDGISNKILIAEDDRTNRMFLKKGVSGLPYEFVFAETGDDALDKILSDNFDLLVLDVNMPGLSGFEVIQKYKELKPDFKKPFMFLTGQSESESISKGFALGAVDYITKPFTMVEIRLRIKTHHDLYKSQIELNSYAKDMESLAKQRADQLVCADRLATLGTMSAGIMHEINNPTTFISGNVQIMKSKFFPVIERIIKASPESETTKVKYILEEMPKMFDGINTGVARIKKITDGLKTFSRSSKKIEQLKPHCLKKCITNSITFTKSSIPSNVQIEYIEPTQNTFFSKIDSQQIEQVMINLIINSSHAIEEMSSPTIKLSLNNTDSEVIFKIKDNGPGIPSDVLKNIFEPFFTTKVQGKGTGLGLAICQEIINAHNGSIKYTGDDNGAEFTILLPKELAYA